VEKMSCHRGQGMVLKSVSASSRKRSRQKGDIATMERYDVIVVVQVLQVFSAPISLRDTARRPCCWSTTTSPAASPEASGERNSILTQAISHLSQEA